MSVRVGTCSWADDSLSKLWYPRGVGSAEARLRYYADHFDTVEVNSSYYALPAAEAAHAWVERTPPGRGYAEQSQLDSIARWMSQSTSTWCVQG